MRLLYGCRYCRRGAGVACCQMLISTCAPALAGAWAHWMSAAADAVLAVATLDAVEVLQTLLSHCLQIVFLLGCEYSFKVGPLWLLTMRAESLETHTQTAHL